MARTSGLLAQKRSDYNVDIARKICFQCSSTPEETSSLFHINLHLLKEIILSVIKTTK